MSRRSSGKSDVSCSSPPTSIVGTSPRSHSVEALDRGIPTKVLRSHEINTKLLQLPSPHKTPQANNALVEQLSKPRSNERLAFNAVIRHYVQKTGGEAAEKIDTSTFENGNLFIFESCSEEIWQTTRRVVICSSFTSSSPACHSHCK